VRGGVSSRSEQPFSNLPSQSVRCMQEDVGVSRGRIPVYCPCCCLAGACNVTVVCACEQGRRVYEKAWPVLEGQPVAA
jgi:hypothetical protein